MSVLLHKLIYISFSYLERFVQDAGSGKYRKFPTVR